jgi:hypothetical protein
MLAQEIGHIVHFVVNDDPTTVRRVVLRNFRQIIEWFSHIAMSHTRGTNSAVHRKKARATHVSSICFLQLPRGVLMAEKLDYHSVGDAAMKEFIERLGLPDKNWFVHKFTFACSN